MTMCIQCALEAFVAGVPLPDVSKAAVFEETPDQHKARVHPDAQATYDRRQYLNREAAKRMGGQLLDPDMN